MCMGGSKAPKATPPPEPLKNTDAAMANASADAARQQSMRRGLASVWTRYQTPGANAGSTPDNSIAAKADKLGG